DRANPLTSWTANNYLDDAPTVTTNYWADVVAGSCTSSTTTTTVTVCIPNITQQPASTTIANGSSATLSVTSSLPGSTYQWYTGTSGTTTSPINNATSSSVTVTPGATTSYWCKVTGTCSTAVNSNTATVTVCTTTITQQPTNQGTTINV